MCSQPRNSIECHVFSEDGFIELVRNACPTPKEAPQNEQTAYLGRYLKRIKAETVVVERHYVDRNYIEEVGYYYSRCFVPRPNSCTRIHAFARRIDDDTLDELLTRASQGDREAVERELTGAYLGFIVIRPLPSVPIGRTVLRHQDDGAWRKFPAVVSYPVHFLGLRLSVKGVAFQQQDRAVAACATTAIWTALQRVCRHDGARPPTTSRITEEAARHSVPAGRALPSPGLTVSQICDALRAFEFAPDVFRVEGRPELFQLLLNIYLRSGIPVLLALYGHTTGHAVTAVGYGASAPTTPAKLTIDGEVIRVLNLDYDRIYIHDDRLGPYARATFRPLAASVSQRAGLDLEIRFLNNTDRLSVVEAAAPLYTKIRSSANELLQSAAYSFPLLKRVVAKEPGVELFFQRSGDYLASLYSNGVAPKRLTRFLRNISLSRYVGVARWYSATDPVLDTLWDTTDRIRGESYRDHLLGAVALHSNAYQLADTLEATLGIVGG